jgi:hypothetical protein
MMKILKPTATMAATALLAGLVAAAPVTAGFYTFASADMALGNLRLTFSDPDAALTWEDEWFGEVPARAQDTVFGSDDAFDAFLGNAGDITATVQTTHVSSLATYQVIDGENVAIDPGSSIVATTRSELEIAGKNRQGDGAANARFDNYFSIASLNPSGSTIAVTLLLDYAGALTGTADAGGFFDVTSGAFIELYAVDQVTGDVSDLLAFDQVFDTATGTNRSYTNALTGTLAIIVNLFDNQTYWLYAEADSETYGAVPLPATLPLMLLGFGLLAWRRRR